MSAPGDGLAQMRGLSTGRNAPLRAADLVPGRLYLSPGGHACRLLPPADKGIGCNNFLFSYVSRTGRTKADNGFSISEANAQAIAAFTELGP